MEFYDNIPTNKYAGGARNLGLSHAEGEWILFGDADDFFLPEMEENVEMYYASEADVVCFPPISQMDDGIEGISQRHYQCYRLAVNYIKVKGRFRDKGVGKFFVFLAERKLRLYWPSPCSKMIRRSLIIDNNLKFDLTPYANDRFFSVQVGCLAKKVIASSKEIYCITESERSLTKNDDPKMQEIRNMVKIKSDKYIKEHDSKILYYVSLIGAVVKNIKKQRKKGR